MDLRVRRGEAGRAKTRRAIDVNFYCLDLAPVLSRFVGPFFNTYVT
jgi:hypothetical protein